MISYNNTAKEIEISGINTAILPIGSVEQHSSHLPVSTDLILAERLSAAIAERIDALLLPALPISTCYEHKGVKGSVYMRPTTFYKMLQDVILSLRDQGISRVIVVLGHGGIFVAAPAIRELNAMYDELQVVTVDVKTGAYPELLDNKGMEIHAGESETSVMLYLCEDLVDKELMLENDFVPDVAQSMLNCIPVTRLSKTGAWGKPSLATREKGERIFSKMVDDAIKQIDLSFEHCLKEKW